MKALLIGKPPDRPLGWDYVTVPPYEGVVIGSLTPGQLLCFCQEAVFDALCQGKPVLLYTPGLPEGGKCRPLAASFASAKRTLKSWGIVFTDGGQKKLITAQEANALRQAGKYPQPGAVLTPLAREILEGKS